MEVSETKLVNFAEKTRFDVGSEYALPKFEDSPGNSSDDLVDLGLTLIYPEVSSLLKDDGTWDESKPAVFHFLYQERDDDGNLISEQILDSIDDVPMNRVLRSAVDDFIVNWKNELRRVESSQKISVFQLDPNQLLTITSGFKVVSRRPLGQ